MSTTFFGATLLAGHILAARVFPFFFGDTAITKRLSHDRGCGFQRKRKNVPKLEPAKLVLYKEQLDGYKKSYYQNITFIRAPIGLYSSCNTCGNTFRDHFFNP